MNGHTRRPRIIIPMNFAAGVASLRPEYVSFIERAGGEPVLVPPDEHADEPWASSHKGDGLLLTGGGDIDPARYGQARHPKASPLDRRREAAEFAWFNWADRAGVPVLGICLGCQVINVARGGSLHQHLGDLPGIANHAGQGAEPIHDAAVCGPLLGRIVGPCPTGLTSRHKQAVDAVGRGLVVAARAGDGIIEAVEDAAGRFVLGVQWHPEDQPDHAATLALAQAFIEAAR
jgi:putative glutamine amidotransferase